MSECIDISFFYYLLFTEPRGGINPERTGLVLFIHRNFDKLDQITDLLTNLENVKLNSV